jgi:ubiquinone/menaquinone biosynthesis C-methylase UbiE
MRTFECLILCVFAMLGWPAPATAEEQSVHPRANERYKSPNLDADDFTQIFERESREVFALRHEIVESLDLKRGVAIADVGAGTGLFMELFAEAVGVDGKVYAVEISPKFVEHLRERALRGGLQQVEVVESEERFVPLPEASIDVAFLCDTYHHLEYPQTVVRSLRRALRPGGRLVVVDFDRDSATSRKWVLEHVRAGKQKVSTEIASSGFTLEKQLDVEGLVENYMLQFRRRSSNGPVTGREE